MKSYIFSLLAICISSVNCLFTSFNKIICVIYTDWGSLYIITVNPLSGSRNLVLLTCKESFNIYSVESVFYFLIRKVFPTLRQ